MLFFLTLTSHCRGIFRGGVLAMLRVNVAIHLSGPCLCLGVCPPELSDLTVLLTRTRSVAFAVPTSYTHGCGVFRLAHFLHSTVHTCCAWETARDVIHVYPVWRYAVFTAYTHVPRTSHKKLCIRRLVCDVSVCVS